MINQITDQLFLSQVIDLLGPEPNQALASLAELGITHVVSVCPEPELIEKEAALLALSNNIFCFHSQPVPTATTNPNEDPWVKGLYQAIDTVNRNPTTNPNRQNPSPLHRRSRQKPLHSRHNNRPTIQHATQPRLPNRKTSTPNNT